MPIYQGSPVDGFKADGVAVTDPAQLEFMQNKTEEMLASIATFPRATRDTIVMAAQVGYTIYITGYGMFTLASPDEKHRFHISRRTKTTRSMRIKILEHGDQHRVALLDRINETAPTDDAFNALTRYLIGEGQVRVIVDDPFDKGANVKKKPRKVTPAKKVAPAPPKQDQTPAPERTLVSSKPMLARAHEGRAYESKVAIEQTWSDGTVDYRCALCDFTGERLSVRGHWQKHVRDGDTGRTKRGPQFDAAVPLAVQYAPRQSRIDALAEQLAAAWAGVESPDFEAIAKQALTWVHEQSRKGTEHAAEREELTDTDTLNRIRTLLDQGQYTAQRDEIDRLAVSLTDAQRQLTAMEAKLAVAERRADHARENLRAFTELALELNADDEDAKKKLEEAI